MLVFQLFNKVEFSKGELKKFIQLLFLHFPHTSPNSLNSVPFWDVVEKKFWDLAKSGDVKANKSVFWPLQIRSTVSTAKGMEKGHSLNCSHSVSPSSSPHACPKPSFPKVGVLNGATSKPLPTSPGSPQVPRFPHLGSLGLTTQDSCGGPGQAAREPSLPELSQLINPEVGLV